MNCKNCGGLTNDKFVCESCGTPSDLLDNISTNIHPQVKHLIDKHYSVLYERDLLQKKNENLQAELDHALKHAEEEINRERDSTANKIVTVILIGIVVSACLLFRACLIAITH